MADSSSSSSSSSSESDELIIQSSSDEEAKIIITSVVKSAQTIVEVVGCSRRKRRKALSRNRVLAHEKLVQHYFATDSLYDATSFRRRFRMNQRLFLRIVNDLETNYTYFQQLDDARGVPGFSPLQKVTAAIRQLAYGTSSDIMDDYLQMSDRVARDSLHFFCECVIQLYQKKYLRKPSFTDVQNLLEYHDDRHGFPGMLGSIDCMEWEWENCPTAWRGQHSSGHHKNPGLMLEAVASQDLWFWHAFFGVAASNNDINIVDQSPIFNDFIDGVGPCGSFFVNDVEYKYGYYLADGIYPEYSVFVKAFTRGTTLDDRRTKFNIAQMAARKDVERAFGVLKKRWHIIKYPCRFAEKFRIRNAMYACIILHNMILEDEGAAICDDYVEDETQTNVADIGEEARQENRRTIFNSQTHNNLRADLVEHIWRLQGTFGNDE